MILYETNQFYFKTSTSLCLPTSFFLSLLAEMTNDSTVRLSGPINRTHCGELALQFSPDKGYKDDGVDEGAVTI